MGTICPVCGILEGVEIRYNGTVALIICPCCGRFYISEMMEETFKAKDKNKFSAYLYYHSQKFLPNGNEGRGQINFLGSEESFNNAKKPNYKRLTDEVVENWYPKTFSEKIDKILLGFAEQSKYHGDYVALSEVEKQRAYFIDHLDTNGKVVGQNDLQKQIHYMSNSLKEKYTSHVFGEHKLNPAGWARVDELKKNAENKINTNEISPVLDSLKEKFSSDYISVQIDLMLKMQKENPTEAIGKAKELIESCCKTILERNSIKPDKNWDIVKLVDETRELLKIRPEDISTEEPEPKVIKTILGSLKAIATSVAQLRNSYGSGHGKSANYKGLEERYAKLAIGSSAILVHFLWDSYEKQGT